MKTTFDIPDSIYREFKARTATSGETMRNVALALIVAYNATGKLPVVAESAADAVATGKGKRRPVWAGIAESFITRYPKSPLDNDAMREAMVAARKRGAL